MRSQRQIDAEARSIERAKTEPFLIRWREQGGYIGALSRQWRNPTDDVLAVARVKYCAKAAVGHMPFPGHRHCGEWT